MTIKGTTTGGSVETYTLLGLSHIRTPSTQNINNTASQALSITALAGVVRAFAG